MMTMATNYDDARGLLLLTIDNEDGVYDDVH